MKKQVKLGAAGLALVAICGSYELVTDHVTLKTLEEIGFDPG